ncbi:restriction endonuclease subunit S [Bifidobacterium longum]|nr:restriction endonuclease subunit S [Bifidobacterium longum]MDL5540231.1 restriction endonuclease subunit S [Bifidobacterium longum]
MMTEQAKVPAIRFAGFTDPWEQRELVDIAEIVGGGTPDTNNSNYWDGDIDWYAPAELGNNIYAESSTRKITQAGFDSCSTKMLPADKTILFTSRAGIGNTAILRHSACTNQGFQSLVIGDADVYFVYSMSERIKKWAEEKASGSTFLEISGRQLETMPVNLPSLVEQQAIGSFFSHLDDLITLHQRKYDKLVIFKKSMLEKMFPKDGESVPEIRFAGFTDPWEQRKLGEIADKVTEKNLDGNITEVLTNSAEYGVINQTEFFDHAVAKESNIAGYYVIAPGDFVYNPRISATAPVGPIRRNTLGIHGVMSPLYTVFRLTDAVDGTYLSHFFKTNGWHGFMKLEGNSGARSDRFSIGDATFFEMPIPVPSSSEQHAIGSFFSRLDDLITLHQRKLELLQNIKKSLLDKMFV